MKKSEENTHRCEDPICWRADGTHAEGCVFWLADLWPPQVYLNTRERLVHGNKAKIVMNPPKFIKGKDE